MKRIYLFFLGALAMAVFAGLVYAVLKAAHVSEPAATTLHGPTARRLWATAAVGLAVAGVVAGGFGLRRRTGSVSPALARRGALAAVNGGGVLAVANGGPGSGNGVVGGAAALVLGLIALGLGLLAIRRVSTQG